MRLGIVIGRFQPVHNGHLRHIMYPATQEMDAVLVLLGSSNTSNSSKNPFPASFRERLIRNALPDANLHFEHMWDYPYSDEKWIQSVTHTVQSYVDAFRLLHKVDVEVFLYGTFKDESSSYLRFFPDWNDRTSRSVESMLDASQVRQCLYEGKDVSTMVPHTVLMTLREWAASDDFKRYQEEHFFLERYKAYAKKPDMSSLAEDHPVRQDIDSRPWYPPVYVTTDAVVVYRNRVLMIRRGQNPGKGLHALPGGFLGQSETLLASCIREVLEETRILLKPEWVKKSAVFDYPNRSLRGRTVSHGYLFEIPPSISYDEILVMESPTGGDDASHAEWIFLDEALRNSTSLFEDHYEILTNLLERI